MRSWNDFKKTMKNEVTLWSASKQNDIGAIQRLIAEGAEVNAKDSRGYSPLMLAVYSGNLEAAQVLVEFGANVNDSDFGGNTMLMGAAFKGHTSVVHLLLNAGANAEAVNHSQLSAMDFATIFGRTEVQELLALKGVVERSTHRVMGLLKLLSSRFATSQTPE